MIDGYMSNDGMCMYVTSDRVPPDSRSPRTREARLGKSCTEGKKSSIEMSALELLGKGGACLRHRGLGLGWRTWLEYATPASVQLHAATLGLQTSNSPSAVM